VEFVVPSYDQLKIASFRLEARVHCVGENGKTETGNSINNVKR
jgi:hypothetical protein